jgi:hypothetical protein
MTVNVGVIGVGMIGQEHIRRLTTTVPGATVVAVSDVDESKAREAAALLSRVEAYTLGEDLILARDVEAVDDRFLPRGFIQKSPFAAQDYPQARASSSRSKPRTQERLRARSSRAASSA